jgi:O-succinylbenzoic acid--CoA ligase
VTTLLPDQAPHKLSSSGLPLPLTELRITTPTGVSRSGEVGEIEIRGPTVFAGYVSDGLEGSRDTADGWFRTGDAGHLDGDGYLYVLDRRDDLIISGGENVYPAEIERVLHEHPSVLDVGVIGVAHKSWGCRPVAAVVWSGAPDQAHFELLRHCRKHLPGYKTPDHFLVLSELPRSPSGKLLRRALREMIGESPERMKADI